MGAPASLVSWNSIVNINMTIIVRAANLPRGFLGQGVVQIHLEERFKKPT